MPESRKAEIRKKYASIGQGKAAVIIDETNAHYAEELLGNRNTLEMLFDETPTIKDKIISFFRGAKSAYANDTRLSRSASKLFNTYKKLFEEFSMRNQGNNDLSSSLRANSMKKTPVTNINDKNMRITRGNIESVGDVLFAVERLALGEKALAQAENFQRRIDVWDGKTEGFSFVMGDTPQYLSELEIRGRKVGKKQVRIDATKLKSIMREHSEMTKDVIKNLPYLLNDPILVLDSKTVLDRLILLGEVYANGNPVMMAIEINPSTRSGNSTYVDVIKIASAYTRTNTQNLISKSNIRYISENKSRVEDWLKVNRLQLPLPNSQSNSATTIIPEKSKKSNSFSEKMKFPKKPTKGVRFRMILTTQYREVQTVASHLLAGPKTDTRYMRPHERSDKCQKPSESTNLSVISKNGLKIKPQGLNGMEKRYTRVS